MIYFTAGLLFGNEDAITFRHRPFSSVEQMDNQIIKNWNDTIKDDDTVYIIGDMFSLSKGSPKKYLTQLKGRKYLVFGFADKKWMKKIDLTDYFIDCKRLDEIDIGDKHITMCYLYFPCWPRMNYNGYMVFGSQNEFTNGSYWRIRYESDNILDASVDVNNFRPVTFGELIANNKRHKITSPLSQQIFKTIK